MQKLEALLANKYTGWVLAALTGTAIGIGAFGSGREAALAVILPLAVGFAMTRAQAFIVATTYILGVARGCPAFAGAWTDDNLLIGWAYWLASGLIGGAAWSLGWTASQKPWRKAVASMLAWTITLLPPIAVFVPGHTVIAWGFVTPGWGWFGVALSLIAPAAILFLVTNDRSAIRNIYAGLLALAVVLFVPSLGYTSEQAKLVNDIAAITTKWGLAKDSEAVITRIEKIGKVTRALTKDPYADVVIFPESTLQAYEPGLFPVLQIEVLKDASRAGQTIILGADVPSKGNYQNSAIAFYPDGSSATALARQTVPVALWKPWQSTGGFETNWAANNILQVREGVKARVIFCYEEYMPILSLINEARDDHQLVIVMSNTWAARDQTTADIQWRHSEGVIKLFGRRVLRSENRPLPT